MPYTLDSNSCIKGGTYTLGSGIALIPLTIGSAPNWHHSWADDGNFNNDVFLEDPLISMTTMTNANDATKIWCTVAHTISSPSINNMAYTIYALAETQIHSVFNSGCSDEVFSYTLQYYIGGVL